MGLFEEELTQLSKLEITMIGFIREIKQVKELIAAYNAKDSINDKEIDILIRELKKVQKEIDKTFKDVNEVRYYEKI